MEGGCCIARYGTGGGGGGGGNYGVYNMSQVDRIMLRFRPIAPKPSSGGCSSPESKDTSVSSGRPGKRRYVRNNNKNNNRSNKDSNNKRTKRGRKVASSSSSSSSPTSSTDKRSEAVATKPVVATLPLLRDGPALESPNSRPVPFSSDLFFSGRKPPHNIPVWLNFNTSNATGTEMVKQSAVPVLSPNPNSNGGNNYPCLPSLVAVVSLTVECVTETWLDVNSLGCTDEEKRRNLEVDTCPGFISDGLKRVTWTNQAFRKMVARQSGEVEGIEGMIVRLAMKEGVASSGLAGSCPAFTCSVRMHYTCGSGRGSGSGKENNSHTQVLPCDVWRMDGGCGLFAWRLDVRAALSLSLGLGLGLGL